MDIINKHQEDEFLRIIAHEFQTPLTIVKSALSLALTGSEGSLSPLLEEDLKEAQRANEHILNIVSNIITAYNIDAGTFGFDPKPTDIKSIIEDKVAHFTIRAHRRNVTIETNIGELPMVMANETAVSEIFKQLLDNAIKIARGIVEVSAEVSGGMLWVHVADDGQGISANDIDKLFKKFSHTSYDYTMQSGGVGLGLYIAYALTKKFNGDIKVVSDNNKTMFSFSLPIDNE